MNDERLTEKLAVEVMGWRLAADRFVKAGRTWLPKRRFQPLLDIAHAFQLLDEVADKFALTGGRTGPFVASVQIGRRRGTASGESKAGAITHATARALGFEVDHQPTGDRAGGI
jgi:hypothetical protein